MFCSCRNIFLFIFLYLSVLLNNIGGVKITDYVFINSNELTNDAQPVLLDSSGGQLQEQLDAAINDNEHQLTDLTNDQLDRENEQRLTDLTGGLLEKQLEEAIKDDAHVPSSLDNSLFDTAGFESLSISPNSLTDFNQESKYVILDKVPTDTIPSGITTQDYSLSDKVKIIRLYKSNKIEDLRELFQFISQHIHNKYRNCASNFGKWLTNSNSDEPIFYRNCIPCTNAVDLNLQSLFNQQINLDKLKHYFVNTCEMGTQWISYISNMEYLPVDLKRHPTTTFTDVIRQNLLPNQRLKFKILLSLAFSSIVFICRYVFQGIVKSERGTNHKGFFHVCNLINDEYGHLWIIDGQIERVFDLNESDDIKELDEKYRPDYVARASTGLFRPPQFEQNLKQK